jgi:hypothetical protein
LRVERLKEMTSLVASISMAKKATTPSPPKRVQAPQARSHTKRGAGAGPDDERRRRILLYALGASGFIGLLAVLLFLVFGNSSGGGGSSESGIAKTLKAEGYSYKEYAIPVPPKRQTHVPSLTDKPKWETSPPSGGPHYGTPAAFNFYDEAVTPVQAVHNLEHGGIVIWYGPDVSPATKAALRTFYNESPNGILVTPFAGFGKNIALTAWTGDPNSYQTGNDFGEGHFSQGTAASPKAWKAFRDEFRAKGPERFPLSAMQPNQ